VPFREAHGVVAGLVRTALDSDRRLSELSAEELANHSAVLAEHEQEFHRVLEQSSWLESKISEGGTALSRVIEQLATAHSVLDELPAA
jgi:argininosuccinate lyase